MDLVIQNVLLFLFFFFSFSFFFFLPIAHASNECPKAYCDKTGPIIQFPFWLQGTLTPPNCAPSGFNLSRNGQKYPILHIPNSGNFYVKSVYYYIRIVTLQDVEGCLLKRLLSLNLASTPFMAVDYRNYTFFYCSKGDVFSTSLVRCSAPNQTFDVFAVDDVTDHSSRFSECDEIATLPIPVSSSSFPADLDLTWSDRKPEPGGKNNPSESSSMALILLIPVLFLLLVIVGWVCMKKRGNLDSRSSIQISEAGTSRGLDKSIIETYRKITIEESLVGVTCTICLVDYATNDTIRFMPKCEHFFHVECIDEWLSISRNCPVCRISMPNTTSTY